MKKRIQIVLGLLVGAFLLWYVFKDTNWTEVFASIRDANWLWILAAFSGVLVSFMTRVQRWSYIVRTAKPVSFRSMFSATQIGFLGNFVLPARAGEVIRAVVLSRIEKLPFSKCFAFVALDRVTDLFGLIAVMLVSAAAFHPQGEIFLPGGLAELYSGPISDEMIRTTALSAAAFLLAVIASFVILYLNQRLALRISDALVGLLSVRLARRAHDMLQHFADGMHVFRSVSDMAKAIFFSMITWGTFIVSYWCMLFAFGFDVPWYTPFVLCSLLAVFISIPGPPGFIGPFHAAIVGALLIVKPDINADAARAAAIVAHMLNLVPIVLIGVGCLYVEKFGLIEMSREHAEE